MKSILKFLLFFGVSINTYAQNIQLCTDTDVKTDAEYIPKGSEIPVYIKPSDKSEKVINETLSKAINEISYIEFSNEYVVRELCHTPNHSWSLVKAVSPSYLSDSHVGWIKSSFLKEAKFDEKGFRIIEEEDVNWNDITKPYKKLITAELNKIHRENANCKKIDPAVLDVSSTKGTKSNPVFYVTCGEGLSSFNVFFSLDDMNFGKSQSIEYISQQKAILLCEKDVERRFSKQKLVNFSKFLDVSYLQHPNGRVSLISSITLKNSHGEKDKYSIKCLFEKNNLLETVINKM